MIHWLVSRWLHVGFKICIIPRNLPNKMCAACFAHHIFHDLAITKKWIHKIMKVPPYKFAPQIFMYFWEITLNIVSASVFGYWVKFMREQNNKQKYLKFFELKFSFPPSSQTKQRIGIRTLKLLMHSLQTPYFCSLFHYPSYLFPTFSNPS